ncbi:MAG: hypothetical protein JWQ88_3824 [Rhodoferax sp.]|nr:hypothetical protein [Rhodoferax sp.]
MAVAFSGLAGCASVEVPSLPDRVPPAWRHAATASTPAPADQAPAGSAPGTRLPAGNPPAPDLQTWWKALGDPRLDALVDRALTQNLTLAQAGSRLRQARLLAGRDNMAFRPNLSAGARTVQDVSATDTYFQASFDATWELGLFDARESARRAGQSRLDTAVANVQAAKVSVVAEVVRTYADLRAAQVQQDLLARQLTLDQRSAALFTVQRQQRLGAPDEHSQAEVRVAQTAAQLGQPRQAADRAAQSLALLLGLDTPDADWQSPPVWPPRRQPGLGAFSLQQVPADLLRYRPEIRTAEAEVLKSAAELGSATAELYPRVTLGASLLFAHNLTQNRRTNTDNIPGFGPMIDIPLFDWGRRRAAADAHKEALDASLLAYRQAVLEGVSEAESALGALQETGERGRQLRTVSGLLARRAKDVATLARLRLAGGIEQIATERSALQADIDVAAAEAAQTQAFVALYKALGGAPLPAQADASAVRSADDAIGPAPAWPGGTR